MASPYHGVEVIVNKPILLRERAQGLAVQGLGARPQGLVPKSEHAGSTRLV
jgi:hypothetical protein